MFTRTEEKTDEKLKDKMLDKVADFAKELELKMKEPYAYSNHKNRNNLRKRNKILHTDTSKAKMKVVQIDTKLQKLKTRLPSIGEDQDTLY